MAVNYDKFIYKNSGTPYIDSFNTYKAGLQKRKATEVAQINERQNQAIADSNKTYDANARQNYINYMQNRKALPSQLNSLGIRGGASESSLLRLGTTYGQNVASNEAARGTAQDALRQTYAQQIQELNNNYNQQISDAQATAQQNQMKWEEEQLDKDLQRFSGAIQGLYKSRDSYKKLIEKLKASNDPNKDVKIMLARQAMNQLEDEGGSGGGGGRRRGGGRSYGGSGYGYGDGDSGGGGGSPKSANKAIEKAMKSTVKGVKRAKRRTSNSRGSAIARRMRRAGNRAYAKPSFRIWR